MIRQLVFSLLFTISATSPFFITMVQASETKTVTLDVPGMTCKFCPVTIRKALEKVPGVTEATSSYKTKTATVTFDPYETNVETLTEATANAGYPSTLKQ